REQARQIVGDLETLPAGGDERFHQRLLDEDRHIEPVLDIILLAHRVGHGFAVLVERPAKYPSADRPPLDSWLRRTTLPRGVALDCRQGLAVVLDIGELLTRELHVALGGGRLLLVSDPAPTV